MTDRVYIEPVKPAHTPEEMRKEIYRLRMYDPLVRSAMDAADYGGMSGEDRYVVLAYNALAHRERILSAYLDHAMTRAACSIFVKEDNQ